MRPLTTAALGLGALAAAAFIIFVPNWTHPPVGGEQLAPSPASMIQWGRGQMPEPVPKRSRNGFRRARAAATAMWGRTTLRTPSRRRRRRG